MENKELNKILNDDIFRKDYFKKNPLTLREKEALKKALIRLKRRKSKEKDKED